MLSSLAAWRVSLQRMRADWPIVAAAWLITLLAATLLAAGPVYSDAVSLAGLRRVLADASPTDVNVEITARVPVDQVDLANAEVERQVGGALGSLPVELDRSARSDTFALPDQPTGRVRDLATIGFSDGIVEHTTMLEGSWPATGPDDRPVNVAVAEPVAAELGWSVGDVLRLTNRSDESRTVDIAIAGVFRVDDVEDPFWWGEASPSGASESASFRTFGPLIATPESLTTRVAQGDVRLTWHAFPRFGEIELEQVGGIQGRVSQLTERARNALANYFPTASTQLDQILSEANRSLLVSRTGVLLLIVQLAILAAYAIVLMAGLLADHRTPRHGAAAIAWSGSAAGRRDRARRGAGPGAPRGRPGSIPGRVSPCSSSTWSGPWRRSRSPSRRSSRRPRSSSPARRRSSRPCCWWSRRSSPPARSRRRRALALASRREPSASGSAWTWPSWP